MITAGYKFDFDEKAQKRNKNDKRFEDNLMSDWCVFLLEFYIYWLTKETLQTFFANGSNRNIEIWYFLYSNKWIIATMLFAKVLLWLMADALCDDVICLKSI